MLEKRWASLVVVCSALLVISLDNTILHIALPAIQTSFNATLSELQWIVSSYVLVFASLLLTMGVIGDRLGRKPIFMFGLAWFGFFSLMAAFAQSTLMLIIARALMGFGAAVVMPATLSTVTATFTDEQERAQAIAIWAAVFGLGVGIGPVVGGFLLEHFSWHAVFFVNVPMVIISLAAGYRLIENSRDEDPPEIDGIGVVLSISGVFALVYGIIEAGVKGWDSPDVVFAFSMATVVLLMFACWEGINDTPMLPIGLFKNAAFGIASLALGLVTFVMFGLLLFMSPYLQLIQGYSPLETGIRLLPMALVGAVSAGYSARVTRMIGLRMTVSFGLLITVASMILAAELMTVDTSYSIIVLTLSMLGVGMGMVISPATNAIMGSLPDGKAGIGSAMNDTTRQLGGTLGVAVMGTIINSVYIENVSGFIERSDVQSVLRMFSSEQVEEATRYVRGSLQGSHAVAGEIMKLAPDNMQVLAGRMSDMLIDASNQAFVNGSVQAMWFGVLIMLATTVFAAWLLPDLEPEPVVELEQPIPIPIPITGD